MKEITFRNDDISCFTELPQFICVHDIFEEYTVKHRIAIIAENLHKRKDLLEYIKSHPLIDPQLHCFQHLHYKELTEDELRQQFSSSVKMFKKVGLKEPTVFHPPWNESNDLVKQVAAEFGLTVESEKITLASYIRCEGQVNESVINFHYWHEPEAMLVEQALRIYTRPDNYPKCAV